MNICGKTIEDDDVIKMGEIQASPPQMAVMFNIPEEDIIREMKNPDSRFLKFYNYGEVSILSKQDESLTRMAGNGDIKAVSAIRAMRAIRRLF